MKKTNIFENPRVLRMKGSDFHKTGDFSTLIDTVSSQLIKVMNDNDWAGVSPQNLLSTKEDFYKKIIIIRNFMNQEYFQIINPKYEILEGAANFMHEICGSIETVEGNPFGTLNLIPSKIRVTGFTPEFERIDFVLEGTSKQNQERISFIIHEINHTNGKLISDGLVNNQLAAGNQGLLNQIENKYPELISSFLEFDGNSYVVHSLGNKGINSINCSKHKTGKKILQFHFDIEYDMDLFRSSIMKGGKSYKVVPCMECFDSV